MYVKRSLKPRIVKSKRFVKKLYRKSAVRPVSANLKKYINQVVHKNVENKQTNTVVTNQTIACPSSGSPGLNGSYAVMPSITQGVTQETRIGNSIRIKSAGWKGQINLLPYNSITNPVQQIDVVMYLVKYKPSNTATPDWSKFFQAGNTTSGFANVPTDLFQMINTDVFTLCTSRRFKLGISTNPQAGAIADGMSCQSKFFNIPFTKHMKKVLKFSDNSASPNNDNLWLVVIPVQTDGGSADIYPIEIHFQAYYVYEDA